MSRLRGQGVERTALVDETADTVAVLTLGTVMVDIVGLDMTPALDMVVGIVVGKNTVVLD